MASEQYGLAGYQLEGIPGLDVHHRTQTLRLEWSHGQIQPAGAKAPILNWYGFVSGLWSIWATNFTTYLIQRWSWWSVWIEDWDWWVCVCVLSRQIWSENNLLLRELKQKWLWLICRVLVSVCLSFDFCSLEQVCLSGRGIILWICAFPSQGFSKSSYSSWNQLLNWKSRCHHLISWFHLFCGDWQ